MDRRLPRSRVLASTRRTLFCGIALAPLSLCVGGCADRGADDDDELPDDDLPEDVPEDEVEPRLTCPEVELGPLAAVASGVSRVQAGPCGHLIYEVDAQAYLYSPGQAAGEAEAIDGQEWSAVFAPSGRYAAWEHDAVEGVALRDLETGDQLELPAAQRFGFVPAPDAEHGADLWTCADGRLERAGPIDAGLVAEEVDCDSVRGSSGSPRVVFAGRDHQVRFADLETLEVWTTADLDYLDGEPDGPGIREDWLWIDHDGQVFSHHRSRWESDNESDADWQVMLEATLFVAGEVVGEWSPGGWNDPTQAPRRGAPVMLRVDQSLVVVAGGTRIDHSAEFGPWRLDASGRAAIVDEGAAALRRVELDGELTTLATDVEIGDFVFGSTGEWAALELDSQDCLVDAEGMCEWILGELAIWHEGEGVLDGGWQGLRMELLDVDDLGRALVFGINVSPGPTPDPLPPTSLTLLDASLAPLASVELGPGPFVREVLPLADQRTVVETHESGVGTSGALWLVDPATGIAAVPDGAGVDHNQVWVDARGEQLAFVTKAEDGVTTLFAGSP